MTLLSPETRPVPSSYDKRDTYRGASDGLTNAFEFALVPAILGGVGYAFDRLFGIVPVLTIVMVVVSLVGLFVRMKYRYDDKMATHDQGAVWSRPSSPTPTEAPLP